MPALLPDADNMRKDTLPLCPHCGSPETKLEWAQFDEATDVLEKQCFICRECNGSWVHGEDDYFDQVETAREIVAELIREEKLLAALREITFACESAANLRGLTDLFPYVERAKAIIQVFEGEQS